MTRYNKHKTAYYSRMDREWYLLPRGRKRAPLFPKRKYELSQCSGDFDDYDFKYAALNLLTEEDRTLLLDSMDYGCFGLVWAEMRKTLMKRRVQNYKRLIDRR